ncbi:cytidylyltransferase domain-containing protein [Pseudomonas sp. Irchel 3E20]|uniref:acylneuraminate cytidylyltransferase family protein n=1 Tax=Pseudomonas sp. Irchel 3E20 TaxID=2008983 RepID=UPI000BA34B06|nr:acylneuraminate cytidylyltransferase family protein [Pseudomonas sp. Irchel 3E20]
MSVSCFLPCRKGSERVPRKNIKKFSGYEFGLIQVKLHQLDHCEKIHEVVLSTNDQEILDYARSLKSKKLVLHERDDALSSSVTSTDELVALAAQVTSQEHIVWTHVTSPFYTSSSYEHAIAEYFKALDSGFDSLMSVKKVHGFLWDEQGPLNYDRTLEKWPRTQTIKPVYEVDSAVFISGRKNYSTYADRIGVKPFLHVSSGNSGFDIDWPDDFKLAEAMLDSRVATV